MTVYYQIDNPILGVGDSFLVSFYQLPSNTIVGAPISVTDNNQHSVTLTEGFSYRMDIIYQTALTGGEACDMDSITFYVPSTVEPPCLCGSITVSVTENCSAETYTLDIQVQSEQSMCDYQVFYTLASGGNEQMLIVSPSDLGNGISIPIPFQQYEEGYPKVRILGVCCDGNGIYCFDDSVEVEECVCISPSVSYGTPTIVIIGGDPFVSVSVTLSGGDDPVFVQFEQTNGISPTPPQIFPLTSGANSFTLSTVPSSDLSKPAFSAFAFNACGISTATNIVVA